MDNNFWKTDAGPDGQSDPDDNLCCRCILNKRLAQIAVLAFGALTGMTIGLSIHNNTEVKGNVLYWKDTSIFEELLLAAALGAVNSGRMVTFIGAVRTIKLACFLNFGGALLQSLLLNSQDAIVGRLVSGFSLGIGFPACITWFADISNSKMRGMFLAAMPCVTVIALAASCSFDSTFLFIILITIFVFHCKAINAETAMPERTDDAYWLPIHPSFKSSNFYSQLKAAFAPYSMPEFYRPLITVSFSVIMQLLSGSIVATFASLQFIEEYQCKIISIESFSCWMMVAAVAMTMITLMLMDIHGYRRDITIFSYLCAISALVAATGTSVFLEVRGTTEVDCIPIMMVASSGLFGFCGSLQIPLFNCAEMFPKRTRPFATGTCTALACSTLALSLKALPIMIDVLGLSGICLAFVTMQVLGGTAVFLNLPEMKLLNTEFLENYFLK